MENIGDWLYLIIIAIAGISSFISSSRKKAQQAAQQKQAQSRKKTNNEQNRDFWDNEPTPTVQSRPTPLVIKPQPTNTRKGYQTISEQQKYAFDSHAEGQSSIASYYSEPTTTEIGMIADNQVAVTLDDLPTDTNEWRRAFVYNEIFNRKY